MVETLAELPFIGDQVVCLSHNQVARSGPRKEARPFGPREPLFMALFAHCSRPACRQISGVARPSAPMP